MTYNPRHLNDHNLSIWPVTGQVCVECKILSFPVYLYIDVTSQYSWRTPSLEHPPSPPVHTRLRISYLSLSDISFCKVRLLVVCVGCSILSFTLPVLPYPFFCPVHCSTLFPVKFILRSDTSSSSRCISYVRFTVKMWTLFTRVIFSEFCSFTEKSFTVTLLLNIPKKTYL